MNMAEITTGVGDLLPGGPAGTDPRPGGGDQDPTGGDTLLRSQGQGIDLDTTDPGLQRLILLKFPNVCLLMTSLMTSLLARMMMTMLTLRGTPPGLKSWKRIDVEDPLSAFAIKTKTRLGHIPASEFAKSNWNTIRGMDPVSGKFLVQDRPKPDDWLKMAKSDRLINKWAGDPAFADTRLDDGLSSVVPKVVSKKETDLIKTQRAIGAIGHMVLSASEGFSKLYAKMGEFVTRNIGSPSFPNPEYDEETDDGTVPKYIYAEWQNTAHADFQDLQREWQLDVSEPLAIAARTAAAWHIKTMAVRRDKVIAKIAFVNQKAANAISKIPPSALGMFGGDAAELEKVVKLARDLGGNTRQPFQGTSTTPANTHNNFKRGGGNNRGRGGSGFTPRGGGSSRGGGGGFRNARGRSKNSSRGN